MKTCLIASFFVYLLFFCHIVKRKGDVMFREIVTKAVIGKGKISNSGTIIINPSNAVSKVLGCWIINHYYVSGFEGGKVFVKGRYDLHLWYGYNNDSDTFLHKQTIDYIEDFSVKMKNGEVVDSSNEFVVKSSKYPTCNGLNLNEDGSINVVVEKELLLDVIGETTLKVQVSDIEEVNGDIEDINVNYLHRE